MPVMISPAGQEIDILPAGVASLRRLGWKLKPEPEPPPPPPPEPEPAPEPDAPEQAPRRRGRRPRRSGQ